MNPQDTNVFNSNPTPIQPVFSSPSAAPNNKKLWIFIAAGVILLLILIGSAWVWAGNAKKQFSADAKDYEKSVIAAYGSLSQRPENTQAYINYLKASSDKFKTTISSKPQAPHLLWIPVAEARDQSRVTDLTNESTKLKTSIDNYRIYLAYREGMLKNLAGLGVKISTIDDLKTSKVIFEHVVTELNKLEPPADKKDFHQQKVKLYQTVLDDIEAALSAYEAGSSSGYTQQIQKLATDAQKLGTKQTVQEIVDMHEYYNSLSSAYDSMDKVLSK